MRDLIRISSTIIVRLGLVFALNVWLITRWWAASATYQSYSMTLVPMGWIVTLRDRPVPNRYRLCRLDDLSDWGDHLTHPRHNGAFYGPVNTHYSRGLELPGIRFKNLSYERRLSIRHWVLILVCGISFAALKWVYRKRGYSPVVENDDDSLPTSAESTDTLKAADGVA